MRNAMQLKAVIKNLAKEKHISAQLVMQNFMWKDYWNEYLFQNINRILS